MFRCFIVGLGGFIGSVARYMIGQIPIQPTSGFPIKTFAINVMGAFLIGLITAVAAKNQELDPHVILFLKVGVCGGFTTFSSFALETSDLLSTGSIVTAIAYVTLSLLCGVGMVLIAQTWIQ